MQKQQKKHNNIVAKKSIKVEEIKNKKCKENAAKDKKKCKAAPLMSRLNCARRIMRKTSRSKEYAKTKNKKSFISKEKSNEGRNALGVERKKILTVELRKNATDKYYASS